MNVLSAMLAAAESRGLLSDLRRFGIRHRVSLYADDVVVFAKPDVRELQVLVQVLHCFGDASGLVVNFSKSMAIPIRCSEEIISAVSPALPCPMGQFPCKYLGLPLSLSKPKKCDIQPLLDKLAQKLPFWKARLLTREGRVIYVQMVLTASVIYQLMALDLDPWVWQLIDRLRRGFLWAGRHDARGGHCLVAWHNVCQPKEVGGLGLHNLRWLSAALRARWLWFQRTSSCKPWLGLELSVSGDARDLFLAGTSMTVGAGDRILFWTDPWIDGASAASIAPDVLKLVRPLAMRTRTVAQGLTANAWTRDICGTLTINAVVQYLQLWARLRVVHLDPDTPDIFRWKLSPSGQFSSKSAYLACFAGRTSLPAAKEIWTSFAPLKFKFFGWLAIQNRCWTADRLQRRGLPNLGNCPLCQLVGEDIDHLLLQCSFSRAVWYNVFRAAGFLHLLPSSADLLSTWWPRSAVRVGAARRRAFNSLCLLVGRGIWTERNARVFDGAASLASSLSDRLSVDWREWERSRISGRILGE
jgi:hypothetical protein